MPLILIFLLLFPVQAAACMTASSGAKCATAKSALSGGTAGKWQRIAPPPAAYQAGDILPDRFLTVVGTEYLGLPPVRDGWVYFETDDGIYRAFFDSREVIERVRK